MQKNTLNVWGGKKPAGKSRFYLLYTFIFVLMISAVYAPFYFNHKSFVWEVDGLTQHLPALTYWGTLMRQVLANIFINHTFEIPMWDLSIGYGSDIISTLHYYAIGDPLNLLAVFVPASKTEYLYSTLVLLRLYLAGITFSIYCHHMKKDTYATLVGALIYTFSGYAMLISVRHPYFINPMIYLPILLLGIEKILKKQKPYLFIVITAISALSNFYFFYMLAILIFIYTAFRYIMIFKKIQINELVSWVGKFCGYFLIGTCIAMIIFLPNVILILGSSRYGVAKIIPLFYTENHYYSTFVSFISAKQTGCYTKLSFPALALISIFILFLQKKEKVSLKIGFVLTTIFYLIPFFGYLLNGFASSQNRWIWGYTMLVAFISVEMIPKIFELNKNEKLKLLILTLLYSLLYLHSYKKMPASYHPRLIVALAILAIVIIFVLLIGTVIKSKPIIQIMLIGITCLGIGTNGYYVFSEKQGNYVCEFRDLGTAYSTLMTAPNSLIKELKDDSVYRYDRDKENGECCNTSMLQNLNSVGYRFSMADGNISRFYEELYLNTPRDYAYLTLDNRTILEILASVKYFMIKDGRTQDLPYSYDKFVASKELNGTKCEVYSTDNYLPLGYTYSNYITKDTFDLLSATEKQWALLQGVVLENDVNLEKTDVSFTNKNIAYSIIPGKHAKVDGTKIITSKAKATVTLNFQGLENSETCLVFKKISISKKMKKSKYSIQVSNENHTKKVELLTERERAYCGRNSFLCNLNYNEQACNKITLTFSSKGEYSFDNLSVICQPMEDVDEAVQALKEDTLENLEVTTNQISGTIDLDSPKVLLVSIPYSKGWKAFVDGKEQKVLRANSMYTGLLLDPGKHNIKLTYQIPYLKISGAISALGILVFILIVLYNNKLDKSRRKQ